MLCRRHWQQFRGQKPEFRAFSVAEPGWPGLKSSRLIREEIRQLKTGKAELRKFGLLVGGVFLGLGLLFLWRHKAHYPYFLIPGLALVLLGLVLPRTLKAVYIGWMSLALALGFVVSHVVLTLFFVLVITPIGLVARLLGKDFLRLKLSRDAPTYWLPRHVKAPKAPADYERQF